MNKANKEPQAGIVRGLAWTSVGGDTLQIEVNMMPGKGEIELTGQMGDVMKESAVIGISYVRSVGEKIISSRKYLRKMTFIFIYRKGRFQRMVRQQALLWQLRCFQQFQEKRCAAILP